MEYKEEDYLQLSGIQHFLFCRRQWALIHIEQQWAENGRTTDGRILHEKAHDPGIKEKRKDTLTVRAMRIHSRNMGVSGECDIVEFKKDELGIALPGYEGLWIPYPVEYKHGEKKDSEIDTAQLCAQAICLEEMFCCDINVGYLYYDKTRRRQKVEFDDNLRNLVKETFIEMHGLYSRGYTPMVKRKKACNACSLKEICLPVVSNCMSVKQYIKKIIAEES